MWLLITCLGLYRVEGLGNQNILGVTKPSPVAAPGTTRHKNKFRTLQTNIVYKIPCADCSWSYIGETGRCFHTRKKEHIRNTKTYKKISNIATHAWLNGHSIDFNNARVIDKRNFCVRKTLESWHTATSEADNNSKQLPTVGNTRFFHSKNIPTNSSEDGINSGRGFFFMMLNMIDWG